MTENQRMLLREAQWALENVPCGGIGASGPSLGELQVAAENGKAFGGDATFHQAQLAWWLIEHALKP
jgi:hypothetical protein